MYIHPLTHTRSQLLPSPDIMQRVNLIYEYIFNCWVTAYPVVDISPGSMAYSLPSKLLRKLSLIHSFSLLTIVGIDFSLLKSIHAWFFTTIQIVICHQGRIDPKWGEGMHAIRLSVFLDFLHVNCYVYWILFIVYSFAGL